MAFNSNDETAWMAENTSKKHSLCLDTIFVNKQKLQEAQSGIYVDD